MISGVLFPAALPLFQPFTLQFPAKASLGMGKSKPNWCTLRRFLGILAYKSGWLYRTTATTVSSTIGLGIFPGYICYARFVKCRNIIRVRLFINHENLAIFSDISRRKPSISLSNVRIIYKIRLYIKCVSYPFGRGIHPKIIGRYLDIRLCTIPTVGVYEKQGDTPTSYYLLYYSSPKRAPSPLLLGLLYSW